MSNISNYIQLNNQLILPDAPQKSSSLAWKITKVAAKVLFFSTLVGSPFIGLPLHALSLSIASEVSLGTSGILTLMKHVLTSCKDKTTSLEDILNLYKFSATGDVSHIPSQAAMKRVVAAVPRGHLFQRYLPGALKDLRSIKSEQGTCSAFHLGFKEHPGSGKVVVVNGANTPISGLYKMMLYTSYLLEGKNIHGVYNPTRGAHRDLIECYRGLKGVPSAAVEGVVNSLIDFFEKAEPKEKITLVVHSQGAIITKLALEEYQQIAPQNSRRIQVLAVAPGAAISSQLRVKVVELLSRDPVPYLDRPKNYGDRSVFYCPTKDFVAHKFFNDAYDQTFAYSLNLLIANGSSSFLMSNSAKVSSETHRG